MKCIGYTKSSGEYEGYQYNNVNLHCIAREGDGKRSAGQLVEIHKVKADVLTKLGLKPEDMLNKEVRIMYDKYQKVTDVGVV